MFLELETGKNLPMANQEEEGRQAIRAESIDPERGPSQSLEDPTVAASPTSPSSPNLVTGSPTNQTKRKTPRPLALNVKLASAHQVIGGVSGAGGGGASSATSTSNDPYEGMVSNVVPTPDTPYLTDPLWGRFYLPHGRFALPAMLRFIFCPSFQRTQVVTIFCGLRLRLPTIDAEFLAVYIRQLFSLTTTILIVQAILLGLMMEIAIAPATMNDMYGPSGRTLVAFGAKEAGLIIHQGQWWRLISTLFLQAGLVEYILIALVMLRIGTFLEFRWGLGKYMAIWLVAGSFGQIVSVVFQKDRVVVGGASGVAGLLGAWFIEQISLIQKSQPTLETIRQGRTELLMLIICLIISFALSVFASYNDIVASLASLFMGVITGLVAFPVKLEGDEIRHVMLLRLLASIVGTAIYLLTALYLAFMDVFPPMKHETDYLALGE